MGAITGDVPPPGSGGTGVATLDNNLPWVIDINPVFTPLAQTQGTWVLQTSLLSMVASSDTILRIQTLIRFLLPM
jgi:hypothetical protein